MKIDLQLYKDFYSWDKYKEGKLFNYYTMYFNCVKEFHMPVEGIISHIEESYSDEDYMEYVNDGIFYVEVPDNLYYTGETGRYINEEDIMCQVYEDMRDYFMDYIKQYGFEYYRGDLLFKEVE